MTRPLGRALAAAVLLVVWPAVLALRVLDDLQQALDDTEVWR
jgi:hypothetical protein